MNRIQTAVAVAAVVAVVTLGMLGPLVHRMGLSETGTAGADLGPGVAASDTQRTGTAGGLLAENVRLPVVDPAEGPPLPAPPPWLVLAILGLFVARIAAFPLWHEETVRYSLRKLAISFVRLVAFGTMMFLIVTLPSSTTGTPAPSDALEAPTAPSSPLRLAPLGLLALVLGVGFVSWLRSESVAEETAGTEGEAAAAVGQAAGRAARSVAADDLENVVYRAWHEMTLVLPVENAEAATPGEFATAAVGQGLAPEDVEALTGVFRDVRYGDRPVTEERRRRTREVLRRIEARYGDGEGGG